MMRVLLLMNLLACLAAVPLRAQKELDLSENEALIRQMKLAVETDPSTVDSLADRIGRSSLGAVISTERDLDRRLADIKRWITERPDQAAQVAVGLARDDAEGSDAFETALKTSLLLSQSAFRENPDIDKGIYGRLKKSSKDARNAKKDEEMKDEEREELVKTLFEGDGAMSNKILSFGGPSDQPKTAVSVIGGSGFYDTLSAGNLTGYSPQLLAVQSALNARRVPGAPRLIETGRLDYATLNYPSYQMRFDRKNLELRLRYERNYALARLLGKERSLKPDDLLREEVGRGLEAEAAGKAKLDPRLAKRQKLLDRIKAVLADFEAAASPSRDPSKITRRLLLALGSKHGEAARWITVAALEEELSRIGAEAGFLSAELLRAIDACPVADDVKAAYKRSGEGFKGRLDSLKANDVSAIATLEADGWESAVSKVEALLAQNAGLRKDLGRNIRDYTAVPARLASAWRPKPRWRRWLDDLIRRFLPSSGYALRLQKDDRELGRLKDVFVKIASGDLDAAHEILRAGL